MRITTNFKNSKMSIPSYVTIGSAGFDLQANLEYPVTIYGGERLLIPTGITAAVPIGFEMQIRPRSGLALKWGITVLNSPGTIDSDYRGDIGVILYNTSTDPFIVQPGDRIAQGVIGAVAIATLLKVDSLDETDRGSDGFGSTGV